MQELTQRIAELPWTGLIPVAVVFVLGLIMWASGRRVLRTVFAGAGILVGCVAGLAASEVDRVIATGMPAWSVVVVVAVLLGIIAAAAYRLVLAASIGLLLAGLIPLGVLTAHESGAITLADDGRITVQQPMATAVPDFLDEWLDQSDAPTGAEAEPDPMESPQTGASATEDLPSWNERIRRVYAATLELPVLVWEHTSGPLHLILLAGAASGAVLGLFLGAAAPAISASIVTALGGSLLLLSSGCAMALKLRAPEQWLPSTTAQWLLWWMVAAIIGLGLQWIFRTKPADK